MVKHRLFSLRSLLLIFLSIVFFIYAPIRYLYAYLPSDAVVEGNISQTNPRIRGIDSFLTTPNVPQIVSDRFSTTWVGTYGKLVFVEVGARETILSVHSPHSEWVDVNDNFQVADTNLNLAADGWYEYKINYTANGIWKTQIMTGDNVWHLVSNANIGLNSQVPLAGSGGFARNCCGYFGHIQTANNQWIKWHDSTLHPFCYAYTNINAPNGAINPCFNGSWWDVYSNP